MTDQEIKALIIEMAFVWGDALAISDMAKILEISESRLKGLVLELQQELQDSYFGLIIKLYDDSVQLVTRPEHFPYLSKLYKEKKPPRLSNSALETLAIIAYKQPITRVEIEEIRGVSSSSSLNTLLKRGLIEEAGRLDQLGRPILYKTGIGFLQAFDLSSLDELPSKKELEEELKKLKEEKDED